MRSSLVLVALALGCGSTTTSTFTDDGGTDAAPVDASADDTGLPIFPDAATGDGAPKCNVLNIGILGNPGANPSSNFQTWLQNAGTTVKRIQTAPNVALTAQEIAPYNVIVLDWLAHDYTAPEAAIVKAFVEAGGGLISMTGYNGTATDFRANALIGELGVTYGGGLVSGPVTTFVSHPITKGLTSITFAGGYVVSAPGSSTNVRTPIASIPAGNVAWAIEASKGRAFVWGDEWIEFDSEWASMPPIPRFWQNSVEWASPDPMVLPACP